MAVDGGLDRTLFCLFLAAVLGATLLFTLLTSTVYTFYLLFLPLLPRLRISLAPRRNKRGKGK